MLRLALLLLVVAIAVAVSAPCSWVDGTVPAYVISMETRGIRFNLTSALLKEQKWLRSNACRVPGVRFAEEIRADRDLTAGLGPESGGNGRQQKSFLEEFILADPASIRPGTVPAWPHLNEAAVGCALAHIGIHSQMALSSLGSSAAEDDVEASTCPVTGNFEKGAFVMEDDLGSFAPDVQEQMCRAMRKIIRLREPRAIYPEPVEINLGHQGGQEDLEHWPTPEEEQRHFYDKPQVIKLAHCGAGWDKFRTQWWASWPRNTPLGKRPSTSGKIQFRTSGCLAMYWISRSAARTFMDKYLPMRYAIDVPGMEVHNPPYMLPVVFDPALANTAPLGSDNEKGKQESRSKAEKREHKRLMKMADKLPEDDKLPTCTFAAGSDQRFGAFQAKEAEGSAVTDKSLFRVIRKYFEAKVARKTASAAQSAVR